MVRAPQGNSYIQETSPTRQRCVLKMSLRLLILALDLDRQTDEDLVSNEARKIS